MKRGVLIVTGNLVPEVAAAYELELEQFLNGRKRRMPILSGCEIEFLEYPKEGILSFLGSQFTAEDLKKIRNGKNNNRSVVLFGSYISCQSIDLD